MTHPLPAGAGPTHIEISFGSVAWLSIPTSPRVPGRLPLHASNRLHNSRISRTRILADRLLERGTHSILRGRSYRTRHLKEDASTADKRPPEPCPVATKFRENRDRIQRTHRR
jgi:hypothetical protein